MTETKPYYACHAFLCNNRRVAGHKRGCCADKDADRLRQYMKEKTKTLGLPSTRINSAGCLDRCEMGPVMVIYPEGVWYTFKNEADIDEIVEHHLVGGKIVERLLLPPSAS